MFSFIKIFPTIFWILIIHITSIIWYLLNASMSLAFIFIALNIYIFYKTKNIFIYISVILFFLVSTARLSYIDRKYEKFNVMLNKKIKCYAQVVNIEKPSSNDKCNKTNNIKFKNIIDLNIYKLKDSNAKTNNNYNIRVYTRENHKLNIGNNIHLNIFINNNSDQLYLKSNNLFALLFINKLEYKILNNKQNLLNYIYYSIYHLAYNYRNKIMNSLKEKLSNNTYSMFSTIFLGQNLRNKKLDKIKQKFKNWGISHFLARSGLHIMLIIILFSMAIKFLPLNLKIKNILIIMISITYYLLSWPSISFLRSLYLLLFSNYLFWRNIHTYPLATLSSIALLFLMFNPLYIIRLDFQLTFFITLSLIIFYEIRKRNKIFLAKSYNNY